MTAHRRITDPVEAMAQRVAERVMDLVPRPRGGNGRPARPRIPPAGASPLTGDAGAAPER